jgi:predicted membrane chloride channel (bestrophin family)
MIVRDKSNVFKLLFAWKGTILPKVLPALSFVVFISACVSGSLIIIGFKFLPYPRLDLPSLV